MPSISLPKGGGAIRGIGEKFSTNAATGTMSFNVPISTSKGRAGFDLSLELSYDSGAGNGPFGLGWHLSTPSVARKTDKGLPQYTGGSLSDVFILSGAEDLVRVPYVDTDGTSHDSGSTTENDVIYQVERYRPRTEGLFARIERWTASENGDAHWRAITRDDVLNVYGRSAGARISDPIDAERTFSWLLEETRDDRGNVARYIYKAEDGAEVSAGKASESNRFDVASDGTSSFRATAQRYLKRILYGNLEPLADRAAPLQTECDEFLFEVVLDYGEHDETTPTPDEIQPWSVRSDPFSSYRSTFEVRTYRLCQRILMFHRFTELVSTLDENQKPLPCLVRSTDFDFDECQVVSADGTYSDGPVATYLVAVTQAGYRRQDDGTYVRAAFPPLSLSYSRPVVNDQVQGVDRDSLSGIANGVEGSGAQWVDLDGEGIPGVLIPTDRAWYYKENRGAGNLASPSALRSLPAPSDLRGGAQQLVDIGGDGNLDLVRYSSPGAGYFERKEDGGWRPFVALAKLPNIDWKDPNLRFIDLDGDGFPDVLVTEHDAFVWYRSLAKVGFEPASIVPKPKDERDGPTVVFADGTETIQLADISGDGLMDIVRVRNGEVCYWPNLGYGRFGRKVTMDQAPRFDTPDQFDPTRIRFADVDGSGTSDIIYMGRDGVRLYFNESGNGLTQPLLLRSFGPVDSMSSLGVVDFLGQGTPCLVWSSPVPGSQMRPVAYVDLMGGQKPHLLVSAINNLGGETRVGYAASTKFYLADKAAGTPWLTRLAFPVQVVEQIEHYDHVAKSKLVTNFAYHHGYFDGFEREFRGFARVEQWDAESFGDQSADLFPGLPRDVASSDPDLNLPPVRTVTWFHTGAWLERERLERALSREYYGGAWIDGSPASGPWQDYFGRDPTTQDPQAAEFFLPDTVFELDPFGTGTPDQLSVADQREAVRALRGQILRQEIYAEDGTDAAPHPYSVSERNYQVRRIQSVAGPIHGVFFAHPLNQIDLHYERGYLDADTAKWKNDDPRIQHAFTLAVDAFGNVTRSATVAYPRRPARLAADEAASKQDLAEQSRLWATLTDRSFANQPDEISWYRVGVAYETVTSELTGLSPPAQGVLTPDYIRVSAAAATEIPYELAATSGFQLRVVERQRSYFYADYPDFASFQGDASGPLPLGQITQRALAHQSYRQVLTPGLVTQIYGAVVTDTVLQAEGFYVSQDGTWWAPSGRSVPDPAQFYQAAAVIDAFGGLYAIQYDAYSLLVLDTADPLQNHVTAGLRDVNDNITQNSNDYRVLAPGLICDPNRNRTSVAFDPLGMVIQLWQMGQPGTTDGDTQNLPGVVFQYDLGAFQAGADPAYAHVAKREVHQGGGNPFQADGTPQRQGWQHARSYSDGSGREVMKKVQAEPGPVLVLDSNGQIVRSPDGSPKMQDTNDRWVGTGRTIFDNKGNAVKKYEPFFSGTVDYEDDAEVVQWGVTPIFRYDPLGRLIRTDQPNGTLAQVVFDSWKQATWDETDTVLQSQWYKTRGSPDPTGTAPSDDEGRAAWLAAKHANTPTIAYFDSLGRSFLTLANNGLDSDGNAVEYPTRVTLDVEGNHLVVTDARAVTTLAQVFDVAGRRIQSKSADAGRSSTLFDAANKPIRSWDPRGYTTRYLYDSLQRQTHLFAQQGSGTEFLRQRMVYGETHPEAVARNLLTRAYQSYDGAGVQTNAFYEFKGNVTEGERRLALEYQQSPDWTVLGAPTTTAAIETDADAFLETETFTITSSFDALNRLVTRTTPDASSTSPTYNQTGLLKTLIVGIRGTAGAAFVDNIDYNARGQRQAIQYGNGAGTTYEYDPQTFRLIHQVTAGPGETILQDLTYTYDPVGNIVAIRDGVSYANPGVVADGLYEYDPLYQLLAATGREHPGQQPTSSEQTVLGLPPSAHPNDWQALARYAEAYVYDAVGNILEMSHQSSAPGGGAWSRQYSYPSDSNRLIGTSSPGDPAGTFSATYQYDAAGNMISMPGLAEMDWDHANRLQHTTRQSQNGAGSPNDVYLAYDSAGQRVRKVYEHGALIEENIYLGGYELYRRISAQLVQVERQTLHVMDDKARVALIETKTIDTSLPASTPTTRQRYQIESHLGSSVFELDAKSAVISYEEYHPYGTTAFQATDSTVDVSPKRYRYNGKEKDEETGLCYYTARYYAAWLGRWSACDPIREDKPCNLYSYVNNRPTTLIDPEGAESESPEVAQAGELQRQLGELSKEVHDAEGHHDEAEDKITTAERHLDFERENLSQIKRETSGVDAELKIADAENREALSHLALSLGIAVAADFVSTPVTALLVVGSLMATDNSKPEDLGSGAALVAASELEGGKESELIKLAIPDELAREPFGEGQGKLAGRSVSFVDVAFAATDVFRKQAAVSDLLEEKSQLQDVRINAIREVDKAETAYATAKASARGLGQELESLYQRQAATEKDYSDVIAKALKNYAAQR